MFKVNHLPPGAPILENEDFVEQEHSLAAELAWEYCNKIRHGETPSKNYYYGRFHDEKSREEFDFLVGMNEFVEQFVEHQVVNSGP